MAALNHVAVTVRDVDASGPWYEALLGAAPVLDEHTDNGYHHKVWALDNGTLFGIHQHDRPLEGGRFSEFHAGLEHGGILDAPYGTGLSFRDPDGIALEFFAPPAG